MDLQHEIDRLRTADGTLKRWMTVTEFTAVCCMSRDWVRDQIRAGRIKKNSLLDKINTLAALEYIRSFDGKPRSHSARRAA